jgi:crotonobetainyl-CoA:carnitine CoA-transferase CaiB-like acyl-CoA transferase
VQVALGALEPKFWTAFCDLLELPDLVHQGLTATDAARDAAERVAARMGERASGHWVALAEARNLPLSAVRDVRAVAGDPYYVGHHPAVRNDEGDVAAPTGANERAYLDASIAKRPDGAIPVLGEGTARILAELGMPRR